MPDDLYLRVYADRSELVRPEEPPQVFFEGPSSQAAKQRYKEIAQSFEAGFLIKEIELCRDEPGALELDKLNVVHIAYLDALIDSLTSEVGRALIGLMVYAWFVWCKQWNGEPIIRWLDNNEYVLSSKVQSKCG